MSRIVQGRVITEGLSLLDVIFYHIHDSPLAGHPGRDRSFKQAQRSHFWQSMKKDIFQQCSLCHKWAPHRSSPVRKSPSLPYPIASSPWDAISVDFLKLPLTENGHQYLLVCVDSFFSLQCFIRYQRQIREACRSCLH